jgi:hypothetical protein
VSPHPDLFQGLHGVFNDSLADGWGWLLFDRAMRARGLLPGQFGLSTVSPMSVLTEWALDRGRGLPGRG